MYKANRKHLQPLLISNVNELPEKQRQRLEQSWAGVFYREFFCRLNEEAFAKMYADTPSRPNTPVNVLIGLETLKAGYGWSDEELYDHYSFDIQVRYALGYRDLHEGDFDIRTLYNFRRRLGQYNLAHGENLVAEAFVNITDQQMAALKLHTGQQRMDSTQIASNILDASRLELSVQAIQRLERLMNQKEKGQYADQLDPYIQREPGQFIYHVKGKSANAEHLQRAGETLYELLEKLKAKHGYEAEYQVVERFFAENYEVQAGHAVRTREPGELGSGSLQSLDDQEASFRKKGNRFYKGYVVNVSETCDPENPVQLITQVQVAPNNEEDANLLCEAVPTIKERMPLDSLYVDGGYGSPKADQVLVQQQVDLYQSGIRGKAPKPEKLNLADFNLEADKLGKPIQITCPYGQNASIGTGTSTDYIAYFETGICMKCPLHLNGSCRVRRVKQDRSHFNWAFSQQEFLWALRRKRHLWFKQQKHNPRAAVEAAMRSIKHAFPHGKLPVRGLIRVSQMMILATAMTNLRRIAHYQ